MNICIRFCKQFNSLFCFYKNYYVLIYLLLAVTFFSLSLVDASSSNPNLEQYILEKINLEQIDTQSNSIRTINNIVTHNNYVYVGAQNWLLKLDASNLKLVQSVKMGPVVDSVMCRYYPVEECTLQTKKSQLDNHNKILLVYEQRQALLTCWTAKQGTCDLRDLNDLTRIIQSSNLPTVSNDPFNTTIGFIASSSNSQDLFYAASTYTNQGPYRDDVPALSGRSLSTQPTHFQSHSFHSSSNSNRFMQIISSNSQGLKSSKASIEFMSRFTKTFIVKYVNAFNLGIYNFFLSVQHTDTDAFARGDLLTTKIGRLCLNDLSFTKSYIEMPLRCIGGSQIEGSSLKSIEYNELISAKVVQIKSSNFDSEQSVSDEDSHYLVGVFQKTTRTTFNSSLPQENPNESTASIRQAVCMFPMRQIQLKIRENLRKCYNSEQQTAGDILMRGLNFIKPDQRCNSERHSQQQHASQINDDFCSSADNGLYPIGGKLPLISTSLIEFDSIYFDSIQIWSDSSATSLILLSHKHQEVKFFHLKSLNSMPTLYRSVKLSNTVSFSHLNPVANLQFEISNSASPPSLFVASQTIVYKLQFTTCESFTTCSQCLLKSANINVDSDGLGGDPYCGWCQELNECTTRAKCLQHQTDQSNKWLNGAQLIKSTNDSSLSVLNSMCVDIESIEPSLVVLKQQDPGWIQINFRKELPDLKFNSSSNQFQCVYLTRDSNMTQTETTTEAITVSSNKIKCFLPHPTKMKKFFANNVFKQQALVLADDGLFRQTPSNMPYYYEQQNDKLVVPIYVQSTQTKSVKYGTLVSASNKQLATSFNLTLVDCDAHKSCVSCVNSRDNCHWCSERCVSSTETARQCLSDTRKCEFFDTGSTTKLLIPYTSHRQQAPLTLGLNNLISNQHNMECLFTLFNGEFLDKNVSVPLVSLNKTHVQCVLHNVFKELSFLIDSNTSQGQVQTNLRLYDSSRNVFIDSISNGKLSLLFYKCETKANDCSACLVLNRQLSCMWCQATSLQVPTCRFMNAQSKQALNSQCISAMFQPGKSTGINQCEKPQIITIEPTKLPLGGGTTLLINGLNLGSSHDDILSVNLQCSNSNDQREETIITKCDLLLNKYIPSKQIGCKTRSISSALVGNSCRVSVKLKSNFKSEKPDDLISSNVLITGSQVVSYVDPVIDDIQPGVIIQSANFVWLTIKGSDLDAGRTRQIQIIDYVNPNEFESNSASVQSNDARLVKCEIKNVTSHEIKCRLNNKFKLPGKKNLKIVFDEYMSIMHYLSLRVTTDPLVSSIDRTMTLYSGGTHFTLDGFNFDAVQTAYTYVSYKEVWYSEPVPARERISNERIKFDFPPLNEAFFDLVKQNQNHKSKRYDLQIGFLMDGFNITLKETSIFYLENLNQILVKNIDITNQKNEQTMFSLAVDLDIGDSLYGSPQFSLLKEDLSVYISCSKCSKLTWLNESRFVCQLPPLKARASNKTCELKVFHSILAQLNANKLNLIHFFVGNLELKQLDLFEETNENLKIYLKSYQLENIDNYSDLVTQLASSVNNPNSSQLASLLKQQSVLQVDINQRVDDSIASKNLMLISSIIAGLLVMLVAFTIGVISLIFKIKSKSKQSYTNTTSSLGLSLTHSFLKQGKGSACFLNSSNKKLKSKSKSKSNKKLKLEFENIKKQMDQLEMNLRSKCAYLFQQLHQDYVNELNHDMIYTIGLPIWNYKTYLINILFPSSSLSILNNLLVFNCNNQMTNSSISNSTTNTLVSSNLTPKQQQQQQINAASVSVYATIKSSNMFNFNPQTDQQDDQSAFKSYGHIGEAMQLFDQLIHNKVFLLTFIQVCEENSNETFTLKDRCHLASLLTIGLRDNLPYFYSIIKSLLSDYISNSFQATNSNNLNKAKLLFRTNESLIEPLLTNWISMFMYDFQKDTQCATHLYRLVKVIKFYLDMGPCDQQTQQAANTLNEGSLLKEAIPFQPIYVNIVNKCLINQLNPNVQICRLLDCDTINQAKEKIVDHLYKSNKHLAPNVKDVDLELCLLILNQNTLDKSKHTTSVVVLKETEEELLLANNPNAQNNSLTRLLTLKDYNIQNGSFININYKQSIQQRQQQQQQHVYMSTLSINNEYLIYATNQTRKQSNSPPLPPLVSPPPLLTSQSNRYHLARPPVGSNILLSFSTNGSNSSTETTDTSPTCSTTAKSNASSNLKSSKSIKKKYNKLLTVKSQDSSVTTASLISSSNDSKSNQFASSSSLTRLLVNKGTLQPFIDQFIDTLFSNTSNLPPVVQNLFEFFDQEVKKYTSQVSTTLSCNEKKFNFSELDDELGKLSRIWKTNSYFLRYWINMIKNPDFLLDVNKNWLIDSSLTSIAQALIDSCSNTDSHNLYDTNSPINRLLFMNEVPRYRQMIDKFYAEMQNNQPISDHELHFYLNEYAKCQKQQNLLQSIGATLNYNQSNLNGDFSSVNVLLQLYDYYAKYEQQINAALGKQQCSVLLPVHHSLVQIKEIMMSHAGQMIFNNANNLNASLSRETPYLIGQPQNMSYNQQTINQYQQPMNFYSTSNDLSTNRTHLEH